METAYITVEGIELEVVYETNGHYIPESHLTPAEYPEVYVDSIKTDSNILELFYKPISIEDIEEKVIQDIYDQ